MRAGIVIEPRRGAAALAVALTGLLLLAAPAIASAPIERFETELSTSQAGGHPDITTSFSLASPGQPEAAQDVVFNAATGIFGNPRVATECSASAFALEQCPPSSQIGLATVKANYEGNPSYLLGTAPIYTLAPQNGDTARFAFIVPTLNIPIAIPVAVRTAGDYGLRFTVQDISQLMPLASARLTSWGFPYP